MILPKEHGAYGQMAFPMVTAFAIVGAAASAVLIAATTIAIFLAHEPALILLGQRGSRAKREVGRAASRGLAGWTAVGLAAGIGAVVSAPTDTCWSVLVPVGPAAVLAFAALRGREKTWYGEVASAVAFSSAAVPMVVTAGYSMRTALAIAVPFALLFVIATLAVRVVILRVRGGGDAHATAVTRRAAFLLAAASTATLLWAVIAALLPLSVLIATVPGLAIAVAVAVRPPAPAHLRTLGWTLVAASALTAVTTITAARL